MPPKGKKGKAGKKKSKGKDDIVRPTEKESALQTAYVYFFKHFQIKILFLDSIKKFKS
jgi:hypothetical protein